MTKKRIVLTGGPGTGKTSIVFKLEEANYFCFHEVIRAMTQEVKENNDAATFVSNPIVSVSDPYEFNQKILNGRIQQFTDATSKRDDVLFYDRGIPDVLAYMDYFDQPYTNDFVNACKYYKYDIIFLLPPWKEIYISDDERYENYEQAQEIHHHLKDVYNRLGYDCIEVPFGSVKERLNFILKNSI